MGILTKLKSLLGVGGGRRRERETRIDVDQEPSLETERAVKESPIDEAEPEPTSTPAEEPSAEVEDSSEIDAAESAEPTGSSDPVETLNGIGDAYAARLAEAGIHTVADLAAADASELAEATDIAEGRLENWIEQAT